MLDAIQYDTQMGAAASTVIRTIIVLASVSNESPSETSKDKDRRP